jgi:hypothetical protein
MEIKKDSYTDFVEILLTNVAKENFYITIGKKSAFAKYMSQINELIAKYKSDGTINNLIKNNEELSGLNK